MTDPRRFRLADLIPLLPILAIAAGARFGYLMNYAANGTTDGPLLVQDVSPKLALASEASLRGQSPPSEQDALIDNVSKNRWFGSLAPFANAEERTAHTSPGYPWLVGEIDRLLPAEWGPTDRVMRWIQCVLGTLTAGLYYLFARRAFPSRVVAILTGVFCAFHPFWIVNTAAIADGVLATFLLGLSLWLGVRGSQVGGPLTSLSCGLALAALALVRAALLPFSIVGLLWFLMRSRRVAGGSLAGFLAVLGLVSGLTPWMLRNFQTFGDVYPVVDSAYYHVWMGNNPRATGGPLSEQELIDALKELPEGSKPRPTLDQLAAMSQPARYRELAEAAADDVRAEPVAAVQRRIWAGLYFFFGQEWFGKDHRLWHPTGSATLEDSSYPLLLSAFLLGMLLLGVLGWRWSFAWREDAGLAALAVMWIPLPYLLSHAETLSGPRLPLDGVLLCFSAFALACAAPNLARVLLRLAPEEEA